MQSFPWVIVMACVIIQRSLASWGYPIARGQYLQFGLAAAITVGYFPAVFLTAHYLGKPHPLRRKQSLE